MKQCENLAEVLVALSQGKILIDTDGYRIRLNGETFQYTNYHNEWYDLKAIPTKFSYPVPVFEEPKTVAIDMWVNVYHWGFSHLGFLSREQADKDADESHRIACINIKRTVTEGEGLE